MNLYKEYISRVEGLDNGNRIVAIGNFDGFHIAHQEILKNCFCISRELDREILLITFEPHPAIVLNPDRDLKLITSYAHKKHLLSTVRGLNILTIPFTREFASIDAMDFINNLLVRRLNASHIVSGYNFHFGHNREGNPEVIYRASRVMGFEYLCIGQMHRQYHAVSSSNIRKFLQVGAVNIASDLLGRRYSIQGKVVKGRGRGAELGFRTANINLEKDLVYPRHGVYQVSAKIEGMQYNAIANIGVRPSLGLDTSPVLEVHIFNFEHNIYGKDITVEFLDFMRPERKFDSLSDFKYQIEFDVRTSKGLF